MGDCSGTGGVRGGPMRVIFYNKKRYPKHKGGGGEGVAVVVVYYKV